MHHLKRTTCILLCTVLVAMPCFSVASAKKTCQCGYDPIIYVYGFGYNLHENLGTAEQKRAWIPEDELLEEGLKSLILPLLKFVFLYDYDGFVDSVNSSVSGMLGKLACDESGNSIYNISANTPYASPEHGPQLRETFHYDWRMDVYDNADELREYIEEVKLATGHEKVAIDCESMGSALVVSYLEKYGHGDVSAVILRSGALNGISFIDSIMLGDVAVTVDAVTDYAADYVFGPDMKNLALKFLISTVGRVILAPAVIRINDLFKRNDKVFDSVYDLFGNMPGMWSFVTDENYEAAKARLLDKTENSQLIQKIDRYHYNVRPKIKELLQEAMDDGVNVGILSNYGLQGIPVTKERPQTDFLVDTRYSSCGATCAEFEKTLGKHYVQKLDDGHNHVSPDLIIDASTCMFPENTWFIKGMIHTWFNAGSNEMVDWIIYSDRQVTVHDNEKYPQFLLIDKENDTVIPQ